MGLTDSAGPESNDGRLAQFRLAVRFLVIVQLNGFGQSIETGPVRRWLEDRWKFEPENRPIPQYYCRKMSTSSLRERETVFYVPGR